MRARRTIYFLLTCLPALGPGVGAADFESLHQFNFNFELSRRFTVQLHNRLRTNNDVSRFFQARTGPILSWQATPRLQAISGYYFLEQRDSRSGRLFSIHRPFAGAQFRVLREERHSLDWRNLVERHSGALPGSFTRFRSRALWNHAGWRGWQPYASGEALVLRGRAVGRYAAGVNVTQRSTGHLFALGYEFRQNLNARGSHLLVTVFQFRIRRGGG